MYSSRREHTHYLLLHYSDIQNFLNDVCFVFRWLLRKRQRQRDRDSERETQREMELAEQTDVFAHVRICIHVCM